MAKQQVVIRVSADIGVAGAALYLVGTSEGLLDGAVNDSVVQVEHVVCAGAPPNPNAPDGPVKLTLARPVEIPAWVVVEDGKQLFRLRNGGELSSEIGQLADALKERALTQLKEAQRRIGAAEVDARVEGQVFLGVHDPFGATNAFAGAAVSLRVWTVAGSLDAPQITVGAEGELSAYARVQAAGGRGSVALVCAFGAGAGARLRLDLDDFNLSLPEFRLPTFDPTAAGTSLLELSGGLEATARLLPHLGANVTVQVVAQGGDPKLALRVDNGRMDWALVTDTGAEVDWDDVQPRLASLDVTVGFPDLTANRVLLNGIQVARVRGTLVLNGIAEVDGTVQFGPINGVRDLGPLVVWWTDVRGSVTAEAVAGGPLEGQSLRATVEFGRLEVRVRDEPDAVLAVAGKVEITRSGARLVELRLVEPFPLVLAVGVLGGMAQAAAPVARFVFEIAGATAEQVVALVRILGRIAVAVGRSALLTGGAVGGGLGALGGLLASGLLGLAELAAAVLGAMAQAAELAKGRILVEVRVATDPFAVRQILVTLIPASPEQTFTLGPPELRVEVRPGWRPGILVDLAAQPGAYAVISHADPTLDEVASISTGLWLTERAADGTGRTAPLRDAAGDTGDRGAKPLLSVTLERTAAGACMVAVAGVRGGRGVFFQQLVGTPVASEAAGPSKIQIVTTEGPLALRPLADGFAAHVHFEEDRVLPLLGMGEPGSANGFLAKLKASISSVVWVEGGEVEATLVGGVVHMSLPLHVRTAGLDTAIRVDARLALDTLGLEVDAGATFGVKSHRMEQRALGLVWVLEQKDPAARVANKEVGMFQLRFAAGQSTLRLNDAEARMELRFEGVSSDGRGLAFEVDEFEVGPAGLALRARPRPEPVRLNGIGTPFRFTEGELRIAGGKLSGATVSGRGTLPEKLVGNAECTVALAFAEKAGEGIVLESATVRIDKGADPLICHGTRFTLALTSLDIGMVRDQGYHFFFLVTGVLRFTPNVGEFEDGLLRFLRGVELNLERTPLAADPRVLARHIRFQKALTPKKTFNLFNLFTFEVRAFGYHPAAPKFQGDPAVNISGQVSFAEIGDVAQPDIELHGLWIAPPAGGSPLPRVRADGLAVDLNLRGGVRVRGSVLAVDPGTETVEGAKLAPPGYGARGFLGEGELDIPGWGSMAASLGFLEVAPKERPDAGRRSFFLYAEKRKIAVEIPTPIWLFYLREAGFGFGFRYTLQAIEAADRAKSPAELVRVLDDAVERQGDLHRFSSWTPEPEGNRFTLALKGVMQAFPALKTWDPEVERNAQNPFLFDVVAALRSDFTLFMGVRGWLGTNYQDYLNDSEGLRSNPGLRGYLYISAPQRRLLARLKADSRGHIGDRIPALARVGGVDPPLRQALRAVDWSATLFIKPGLFHYELGWPNELAVRLLDEPNMRLAVRGGMIFRVAEDGLLWAYNVEAEAFFRFSGSLEVGPIGVSAEASLEARLVARMICYLSWRFAGSLLYGLVSLEATLSIAVRAWLEVDLGITRFTLRIGFSISIHFSAAVELALSPGGIGARVHARVAVSAFGCNLSVAVGFTLGAGRLDEARARVQRFLAMSITAEEPDTPPAMAAKSGDARLSTDANHALAPVQAAQDAAARPVVLKDASGQTVQRRAQFGAPLAGTDFWLVLRSAGAAPGGGRAPDDFAYALLVPREPEPGAGRSGFYAAPTVFVEAKQERNEQVPVYRLEWDAALAYVERWEAAPAPTDGVAPKPGWAAVQGAAADLKVAWNRMVATEEGKTKLTLAYVFDECFLSDTGWRETVPDGKQFDRVTTAWAEPSPRRHVAAEAAGGTEQERLAALDTAQRTRAADAAREPWTEAVHQARSTTLTLFLEQFTALADTGTRPAEPGGYTAHVTDLGLVFYGPWQELERLDGAQITKRERDWEGAPLEEHQGTVRVLNPRADWFDLVDPVLFTDGDAHAMAPDGVKLRWRLQRPFGRAAVREGSAYTADNPEHLLHHYEIRRSLADELPDLRKPPAKVKPVSMIGASSGGVVELHPSASQYADDLSDLPQEVRTALLPPTGAVAVAAAGAWARAFGDRSSVTLLYSVTPVDIAGTRGTPRSFCHEVQRPVLPVAPAEAELRFVVTRMGAPDGGPHTLGAPPVDGLAVLIALHDPEIGRPAPDGLRVQRGYRLIADPDDILPSGHYGTTGLTERPLGPPSGFGPTADERAWELDEKGFVTVLNTHGEVPEDSFLEKLEADPDVLKRFRRWCRLAGQTGISTVDVSLPLTHPVYAPGQKMAAADFLATLWRRDGTGNRVATRFALETYETVSVLGSQDRPLVSRSRRVPVDVEVRVEHRVAGGQPSISRPEAFEWPVHLEMPPHAPGQVRVETGFTRFRAPAPEAPLASLLSGGSAVALVRDPERSVLTQLTFDAAPALRAPGAPDPVHAATVAGHGVHALDLADLAHLDTTGAPLGEDFTAWERATPRARVERVSPATARLVPDGNQDWKGWAAHYPSETWRLAPRSAGAGSSPILAGWYSPAESTPRFADRVPRLRLFPTAPEGAVDALMAHGPPTRLVARLRLEPPPGRPGAAAVAQAVAATALELAQLEPGVPGDDLIPAATPGRVECTRPGGVAIEPAALRAALLRLAWKPGTEIALPFAADPSHLDGLTVELEGFNGGISTGAVSLPVPMATFRHPLLEEVLGELEYHATATLLYRRYVVSVQPVQPLEGGTLDGFLAATDPGADPYGWGALHALGLSATFKVYDRDQDRFVAAPELLDRVERTMGRAVARYGKAWGEVDGVGQPFAEVLLKHGRDRIPGPFDAVLASAGVEAEAGDLRLEDDALAIVQLSLRPAASAGWRYHRLVLKDWPPATPTPAPAPGEGFIAGYALRFSNKADSTVEVMRVSDGQTVAVLPPLPPPPEPQPQPQPLPDPVPAMLPLGETIGDAPLLFLRAANDPKLPGGFKVDLVARQVTPGAQGPQEELVSVAGLKCDWEDVRVPDGSAASPFGRFPAQEPGAWAALLAEPPAAERAPGAPPPDSQTRAALDSLRANLRFAQPGVAWPVGGAATFADFRGLMGTYPGWSQRFLDHMASPGASVWPQFALAAPTHANPCHLASDAAGAITLSFAHQDRWETTRAFAVRPTGRYQHMAVAAGYLPDPAAADRLVTHPAKGVAAPPIGYALAVSPRTERVEPPVILASELIRRGDEDAWELVVARHGEEALAFSNRSLFARLGFQGAALSFVREYRTPKWPERLSCVPLEGGSPRVPEPERHPVREAKVPAAPAEEMPDLTLLPAWARRQPSLWKGADVWRIASLPAHYAVTALAVARAGVVVSRVVGVTQDATPRKPLEKRPEVLGRPTLALVRMGGTLRFVVREMRMVSHADLCVDGTVNPESDLDVAWWPDPDVAYTLLRTRRAPGSRTDEEDATVRLVPGPSADGTEGWPVTVRCRGPRFDAPAEPVPGNPTIATRALGPTRLFHLAIRLQERAVTESEVRFAATTPEWDTHRADFNAAATGFASLRPEARVVVSEFPAFEGGLPSARAWLRRRADDLDLVAAGLGGAEAAVVAGMHGIAVEMRREADALTRVDEASLRRARVCVVNLGSSGTEGELHAPTGPLPRVALDSAREVLTLRGLPADDEAEAVRDTGHPLADIQKGGLWPLCLDRLLGGADAFVVRASDTRTGARHRGSQWSAPGEAETTIGLPAWAGWGERTHG